jgi:hypothetical protein
VRCFLCCLISRFGWLILYHDSDGSYGLYLDDTLYEGTSARSITFANDVLCSASGPRLAGGAIGFECVGVEVWGIGFKD